MRSFQEEVGPLRGSAPCPWSDSLVPLQNANSGLCLDVAYFSQDVGGNVLQADCTATDNQLWDLYNLDIDHHGW